MMGGGGVGWGVVFFFSSRRRHTRYIGDWSSDVCSSDLRPAYASPSETRLEVGHLSLDLLTRQAWVEGRLVELSAKEFVLAEVLLRHPMQVMSKEQLLNRVWGYDYDPGSNIIEVYIRHLRRKLGNDAIETVRGMGYRLRS